MRFVWHPKTFAALAAAKAMVYTGRDMPADRIIIESCPFLEAPPLLVVAGSHAAFRAAEHEAYKLWGSGARDRLFARVRDGLGREVGGRQLDLVLERAASVPLGGEPAPAHTPWDPPKIWRVEL